jgi:hypothetical protein
LNSDVAPAAWPGRFFLRRSFIVWDAVDWQALVDALGNREAGVMVEAKGKEHALIPMGIKI